MKPLFYCFFLSIAICIAFKSKAAPDTLFLNIAGLAKSNIVLKINNNIPLKASDNLNPSSATWVFKITNTGNNAVKVKFTNTDGGDTTILDGATQSFVIDSNKLKEDFIIGANVRIDVLNGDNSVRFYQLKYSAGSSSAGTVSGTIATPDNSTGLQIPTGYIIGSPVYDAYNLAKGNNSFKTQILLYYSLHPDAGTLDFTDYKDNKFLLSTAKQLTNRAGDQSKLNLSAAASAIGGLDVTSLADGLAKFIVKRAKQELSIAFFEKFKKVIQQTPDIATVFPQTAALLFEMDNEIYDYERYLQNLREAFKKDISETHRNLPGIIDNHPRFFSAHQPAKAALLTACYTASQLEDQAHPGDILANYPLEYLDPDSLNTRNFKAAIQVIQLISASLKDTATAQEAGYWVGIEQMRKVVNDKDVFRMFLGLLYQQARTRYDSIQFDNTSLLNILNDVADKYNQGFSMYNSYRSYILRFGEKTAALNNMIKAQQEDTDLSDSAKVEKYANYFRNAVDLIQYCTGAFQLPVIKDNPELSNFGQKLTKYFNVAYAAVDLTAAINRKNYSAAINSAVNIYNLVTLKAIPDSTVITTMPLSATTELRSSPEAMKNTMVNLVRYGSFMATVATAKNSDDVETAIEAAALPTGSSRIKRVSGFNVALNAYTGFFCGYERIKNVDTGRWKLNAYGITAPLGVAVSWGHSLFFIPTGRHEWSTSVYISLIDIGAVAAFRFKDDSTAQVPTIQLKDIISPGAFLSIGIPKTPLSFNVGAQFGPNLRKVNSDKNDYSNKTYARLSASLCVDIPVFNFYTKTK